MLLYFLFNSHKCKPWKQRKSIHRIYNYPNFVSIQSYTIKTYNKLRYHMLIRTYIDFNSNNQILLFFFNVFQYLILSITDNFSLLNQWNITEKIQSNLVNMYSIHCQSVTSDCNSLDDSLKAQQVHILKYVHLVIHGLIDIPNTNLKVFEIFETHM